MSPVAAQTRLTIAKISFIFYLNLYNEEGSGVMIMNNIFKKLKSNYKNSAEVSNKIKFDAIDDQALTHLDNPTFEETLNIL